MALTPPRPTAPPRTPRPGTAGIADRWANWRDRRAHNAAQRADRQWRRAEHDQRHRGRLHGDHDPRSPWRRFRDQSRTCTRCGHGGLVGHRGDCDCTACPCRNQSPPYWGPTGRPSPDTDGDPPPAATGSDGPAASTDPTNPAPTDPAPTAGTTSSTDERTEPVTAPTSPTSPVSPTSSGPVSPGSTRPAAGAPSGGSGPLPAVDAADIRFSDARAHATTYAANMTLIGEGLRARDVDQRTIGRFADIGAQLRALVADINREYGAVEQAVNDSRHVAQRDTYRHR